MLSEKMGEKVVGTRVGDMKGEGIRSRAFFVPFASLINYSHMY